MDQCWPEPLSVCYLLHALPLAARPADAQHISLLRPARIAGQHQGHHHYRSCPAIRRIRLCRRAVWLPPPSFFISQTNLRPWRPDLKTSCPQNQRICHQRTAKSRLPQHADLNLAGVAIVILAMSLPGADNRIRPTRRPRPCQSRTHVAVSIGFIRVILPVLAQWCAGRSQRVSGKTALASRCKSPRHMQHRHRQFQGQCDDPLPRHRPQGRPGRATGAWRHGPLHRFQRRPRGPGAQLCRSRVRRGCIWWISTALLQASR